MIRGTYKILPYPIGRFPFREVFDAHVRTTLHCHDLTCLNNWFPAQPVIDPTNDQSQAALMHLYTVDPFYHGADKGRFIQLFDAFVRWLQQTQFHVSLIYQRKPTLRTQLPNNLSVGTFHRDSEYGHPPEEWNIFVPLTDCRESATIHLESAPDKGNYQPVNLAYGECLIFDSALRHGNVLNTTGRTRVSFDFRLILAHEYRGDSEQTTYTQQIPFKIGDYYAVL